MDSNKDVLDGNLVPIDEIPTTTDAAAEDTVLVKDVEETIQANE